MLPSLRCVSFDQRGVGQSTCLDGQWELRSYLDDVECIRTALGLDSWHVLVLYGEYDIFQDGIEIVRSRFPRADQVTLENSGHVHWLQNPAGYAKALGDFFGKSGASS